MKQQIIRRDSQGNPISVSEYGKEVSESLVCPKCGNSVDMLLGEEQFQACEACYEAPATPPERNEAVMPVGDEDQLGQLRGTVPKQMTSEELLVSLGVKK